MKTNTIISALPSLDKEDLEKIRLVVDDLLSRRGGGTATEHEQFLFDAMGIILRDEGIRENIHYDLFKKTAAYKTWKANVDDVTAWLRRHFPKQQTKVEMTSLARLLFSKVLVPWMRENGIPVTQGTLANNVGRLPECFDIAFPGYAGSGLAPMIFTALTKKVK